jgi:hypothetical protein
MDTGSQGKNVPGPGPGLRLAVVSPPAAQVTAGATGWAGVPASATFLAGVPASSATFLAGTAAFSVTGGQFRCDGGPARSR